MNNSIVDRTPDQLFALQRIHSGERNVMLHQVAGGGKTTLLSWAVAEMNTTNVLPVSFSKIARDQMDAKLAQAGSPVRAKTMHQIGYATCRNHFGKKFKMNVKKMDELVRKYDDVSGREAKDAIRLAEVALLSLTDYNDLESMELGAISIGVNSSSEVIQTAMKLCRDSEQEAARGHITFHDQIIQPIKMDMQIPMEYRADVIMIDEVQDYNSAQRRFAMKLAQVGNSRVYGFGDASQSIYGFAGAMSDSLWKTVDAFDMEVIDLNTSFRCPKTHVKAAQEYVPRIEAFHSNGAGEIKTIEEVEVESLLTKGAMVFARFNREVISIAINLFNRGVPFKIGDEGFVDNLTRTLYFATKDYPRLRYQDIPLALDSYYETQKKVLEAKGYPAWVARKTHDETNSIKIAHRLFDGLDSNQELASAITHLGKSNDPFCTVSSIHKIKGLESNNTFFMNRSAMPMLDDKMSEEEKQAERNLTYVALTRSTAKMHFVTPLED